MNPKRLFALIIFLLVSTTNLNAQRFITIGVGTGAFNFQPAFCTFALSSGFAISFPFEKNLIKTRWIYNGEFLAFSSPRLSVWDIGFLYGRILSDSKIQTSISAGFSLTGGDRRGYLLESDFFGSKYQKVSFYCIGIPFEIQFLVNPTKSRSFAITGFANLNKEEPFFGGLISMKQTIKKRSDNRTAISLANTPWTKHKRVPLIIHDFR